MRTLRFSTVAWSIVAIVTVLRTIFVAKLPLTGDEAYYWEWSRRLAMGYVDHPPAVAFVIAIFDWLGRTPFAVRIPFVLCGAAAAIVAGATATRLAGDRRAGAIAALCVTLAPMMIVAFSIASPDGPFALAWAATLYCAVRHFSGRSWMWAALLGVAMGAGLLSRIFGLALCAGIAAVALIPSYRKAAAARTLFAFAVAALLWLPFLWWNASHAWVSFTFALLQRHQGHVDLVRPLEVYALDALAYSPGLWIAASIVAVRAREPIVAWTAWPLSLLFFLLAFHESVEVYWFVGPWISLSVGIGCAASAWRGNAARRMRWTFAPAGALAALLFFAAFDPGGVYAVVRHAGLKLNSGGPFELFTYPALAQDVRRIADARDAYVMTDGYGFSSLLDFYGGAQPLLIGGAAEGQEAYRWVTSAARPRRALFVDKVPFATRPDMQQHFARACGRVSAGPTLTYALAPPGERVPPRRYYTTWCRAMGPNAVSLLRWHD